MRTLFCLLCGESRCVYHFKGCSYQSLGPFLSRNDNEVGWGRKSVPPASPHRKIPHPILVPYPNYWVPRQGGESPTPTLLQDPKSAIDALLALAVNVDAVLSSNLELSTITTTSLPKLKELLANLQRAQSFNPSSFVSCTTTKNKISQIGCEINMPESRAHRLWDTKTKSSTSC